MFRVMLMAAALAAGGPAVAQGVRWQEGGGWAADSDYGRHFNPETVAVLRGEVVAVELTTPLRGMAAGVHLVLKTGAGKIDVHLGPEWYVARQTPQLRAGDVVEVTGSRVRLGGEPVMIAMEVARGDEVLILRDANGIPAWSGWRRRR